jgi:mannose-6-phosphate isomerase
MQNRTKIFRLEGKVQHYAWGGHQFIPALLHQANPADQPFAEYWMGAHDNASSIVILPGDETKPLNEFIQVNPAEILGEKVSKRFGRLPYLLKVLDVKDMLSIQVHPAKQAAEEAFQEENRLQKPLNAPHRNYKDDNHKPELLYALSEFWLLHGFKPAEKLAMTLKQVPELQFLLPIFDDNDYTALYNTVMSMEQAAVNKHLKPLLDRIVPLYKTDQLQQRQEDFWAARASVTFNKGSDIDRGIFSIYLFNLVHLNIGEVIFQDAGIPHAYLEGQNVELMSNSDNVLRGGLTNKHIDVKELMKHTKFEPTIPQVYSGKQETKSEKAFQVPAPDFELHEIAANTNDNIPFNTNTADIFFVYQGSVTVQSEGQTIEFTSGEAFLASAGSRFNMQPLQASLVFRATVPN